uniref:Uncharacterized protein n=1 Tax=Oryza nivara TaxID=4536 RepID=A0A0E0G110_ORYNI
MSKIANIDQEHNFDLDNNTVTLDDLSEGQRCELEQEVEVEIAELREHKLICLQKTKNSVIAKQQKPINLELSANEKEVAMLDLSGNIGPFVLPAEFRAKEVDCMLQLQKSHMPWITDLIREIGLGGLVERSLRYRWEVVQQGSKSRCRKLVTNQDPPKSSGGNGSQLRHSHSLSNWQKKQLHKLSVEKLREKGMSWLPKGSVQVQNKTDVKVKVEAKNEKVVRRCVPNQRFASDHQVLLPPYYIYSSPMQPMHMSWNQFSGM